MKRYMITGGNSGLGYETAKKIAEKTSDNHVILASRNEKKLKDAVETLINETGNRNISYKVVDLGSLTSVEKFCEDIISDNIFIDCLICNAGINGSFTGITEDGFDIVFQTNHLSHMKIVTRLENNINDDGRIIMVSSDMHNPPNQQIQWMNPKNLAFPNDELKTNTIRYSYSKLCNLYFTYYMEDKLHRNVTINAFNPGLLIDTNFSKDKSRFTDEFLKMVEDRIGTLSVSTNTLYLMATSDEFEYVNGSYIDRDKVSKSSELSYNEDNMIELWNFSKELI